MKIQSQRPHTASFIIFRKNGKVALLLRENTSWMAGYWGLVSGKVEEDESFVQAAIREAKEEAGVNLKPENLEFVLAEHRTGDEPGTAWMDIYFEATNWSDEPYNAEPHVHSQLDWFSMDELPENTVPHIKHCLQQIAEGKNYTEYGWDA